MPSISSVRLPRTIKEWTPLLQRSLSYPIDAVPFPPHFYLQQLSSSVRFSPQKTAMRPKGNRQSSASSSNGDSFRPSSVLLLLSPANTSSEFQDLCITLTKRTGKVGVHRGEMSFPGGRMDDKETALATAQREAEEEVGVAPTTYDVVGELTPIFSNSVRSSVSPYVALSSAPAQPCCASPDEVESIHYLHLSSLLLHACRSHSRVIKYHSFSSNNTCLFPCFFASPLQDRICPDICPSPDANRLPEDGSFDALLPKDFPGELVWGLTSFILCELLARLAHTFWEDGVLAGAASSASLLMPSNVIARDPQVYQ